MCFLPSFLAYLNTLQVYDQPEVIFVFVRVKQFRKSEVFSSFTRLHHHKAEGSDRCHFMLVGPCIIGTQACYKSVYLFFGIVFA